MTSTRACAAAFAAVLIGLPGSAVAAEDDENPQVGEPALYSPGLEVGPSATPLPQPSAASFVVADLDTGSIIAAHNAHHPLPPASTMKMLTALTVLPRVDLDTIYTAVDSDVYVEGSKVGIVSGSTYTARQLFEGMFLISGNDAANAVANLNGGIEGTVEQMQAEAGRLQAYDTVVRNANGLDEHGQVSSAFDLALIARAGMARDDFAGFAGLSNSTFPVEGTTDPQSRPTFEIWNQNNLVTGAYDGGIGVKSGYTTNAGRTLAAAAERDGHRYLVTLMGIEGNTYETGARFLDWAFENGPTAEPVGTLVEAKIGPTQSDAAVVVDTDRRLMSGSDSASSILPVALPSPFTGRNPFNIAVAVLAVLLFLWWRLRLHYVRAVRRRQPAVPAGRAEPSVVDLRSSSRVDSRV